jgi:hypothetical protein
VRDWRWIPTAVDTVPGATQAQSGIAATTLTMTLKPGCAETVIGNIFDPGTPIQKYGNSIFCRSLFETAFHIFVLIKMNNFSERTIP